MSDEGRIAAEHDTNVQQRHPHTPDWRGRGSCSCGWLGPWRRTLYTFWFVVHDANKHQRRANRELEKGGRKVTITSGGHGMDLMAKREVMISALMRADTPIADAVNPRESAANGVDAILAALDAMTGPRIYTSDAHGGDFRREPDNAVREELEAAGRKVFTTKGDAG